MSEMRKEGREGEKTNILIPLLPFGSREARAGNCAALYKHGSQLTLALVPSSSHWLSLKSLLGWLCSPHSRQ
jgi:hypothetical protein